MHTGDGLSAFYDTCTATVTNPRMFCWYSGRLLTLTDDKRHYYYFFAKEGKDLTHILLILMCFLFIWSSILHACNLKLFSVQSQAAIA